MARSIIASHPVIAAEIYQDVIRDRPERAGTARSTFYRALPTEPIFLNMVKRGDLKVEPTRARGPGFPKAKWHFNERGAARAATWLNKKLQGTGKASGVKSVPIGEGEPAGIGVHLYRICHSFDIEPVFDGPKVNVEETIARLAKAL